MEEGPRRVAEAPFSHVPVGTPAWKGRGCPPIIRATGVRMRPHILGVGRMEAPVRGRALKSKGTTLVAVLVAVALLALVAAVFASAFDIALRSCKVVGNTAQALSIAQHKIDQMRAVGYGRLTYSELATAGIIDGAPTIPPYSFVDSDNLRFYFAQPGGRLSIAQEEPDVRRVTVEIEWGGTRQTAGDITLVALISRE